MAIATGTNCVSLKCSIPVTLVHSLYKTGLETPFSEPTSSLYRLVAIILDIDSHRLFKPVCFKGQDEG